MRSKSALTRIVDMWILRHLKDPGQCYVLPKGKELVIGRRDCDILLRSDSSVSRKHALLLITDDNKAYLTDCKSKFGTFVDGVKLPWNSKEELHQGAVVTFGQMGVDYRLLCEPLVFCCSSMGGAEKVKLKQLVKSLEGKMVNNWSAECTHLIMSSITVTVKVISALSSCRPILTLAWLEAAVRCMKSKQVFPDCAGYMPPVVDTNIQGSVDSSAFKPNLKRTELFKGLTFFFLAEKQFSKLHLCLQQAGAGTRLASHGAMVPLEDLAGKGSVVMTVDEVTLMEEPEEQKEWVGQVAAYLTNHGLRSVPDAEVGFALLHVSTDLFCNPHVSPEAAGLPHVSAALPPPSLSQAMQQDSQPQNVTIYAADTVSQAAPVVVKQEEEETHDGGGVVRAAGTVRVNETLPHPKDVVVKEEELLDDLFGSVEHELLSAPGPSKPLNQHEAPGPSKPFNRHEAPGSSKSLFKPTCSDSSSTVTTTQPSLGPQGPSLGPQPSMASQPGHSVAHDASFSDSSVSSVLAANSVTPVMSRGSGTDPSVMSALFRGKRKAGEEEGDSQSKRLRSEAAVTEGSGDPKRKVKVEVSSDAKVSTPVEEAGVGRRGHVPALKDSSSAAPKRAVPSQPSGLLFSQQAEGLGTRKRDRDLLDREESPDVGESPDLNSERKRHCDASSSVTSAVPVHSTSKGVPPSVTSVPVPSTYKGVPPSVTSAVPVPSTSKGVPLSVTSAVPVPSTSKGVPPSQAERKQVLNEKATSGGINPSSKMATSFEGEHLQSQRSLSGGEGKVASSAAQSPTPGGDHALTTAMPATTVATATPATPVRLVTMPTASSPFLSTRKHKAAANKSVVEGVATLPSQDRNEDEGPTCTKTQTQDSRAGLLSAVGGRAVVGVSPFNLFTGIGGKRSKVTETDMWKGVEGEEEGVEQGVGPWEDEDPLRSGVKYEPVMTKDGFIQPRKQPRKIVPRGAYISGSHDPTNPVPECVEVVKLVVVVQRHGVPEKMVDSRSDGGGLRDFKRFRKVGSSGLTQMPRIVGLVEHVETSSEVKQWLMEQEEVREPSEDEAEVEDIFRFT